MQHLRPSMVGTALVPLDPNLSAWAFTVAASSALCTTFGFGSDAKGEAECHNSELAPPPSHMSLGLSWGHLTGFVSRAGIYIFFVTFGLCMLVLLLACVIVRFWFEGYSPKVVLMARAHATSPIKIIQLALAQRRGLPHSSACRAS
jgi:hypothetical protein